MRKNKNNFLLQQLKEDLRELKRYLEEFLIFLPLPVCSVTPLGIIVDANQAFYSLTGYRKEEGIKERIFRVEILFKDKKKWQDLEKRILAKGIIRGEEMIITTKDKKEIPVSLSASYKEDQEGNLIGYFLALTDISVLKELQGTLEEKIKERTKELEEAKSSLEVRVEARTKEVRELAAGLEDKVRERTKGLLESREALINMLEDVEEERKIAEEEKNKTLAIITNFADALLVFDKENKLLLFNPKAEEFLGVKSEKVVGKSVSEFSKIASLEPLVKILSERMQGVSRKEFEIGEDLILELSTAPIIREEKKVGTLVILHNVTREKLIEKMKTEFVSLAAHQLRTPLSAIKWTLKMFLEGDLGEINEEQREFLQDTYKSNERMITLINNLLNVTRIEEGRYLYNLIFANLEALVKSIIDFHKEETKKKRIKVILIKPAEKLPETILDVEKIKIAIDNIFDNAIRYTPSGGRVTLSLKYGKKDIELSIKDTGIGIPQKQRKRVFTKFFRGTNVVRMETEGTGLGLFIAKNIIEAHGGKIWFESKEGAGTTFYLTIPIRKRSSSS